jgi:hypothetical protein
MAKSLIDTVKVDRTTITVASLDDPPDDIAYWRAQTPEARLQHMELLRQINYGQAAITGRLQRVLEIATRPPR